ncbi:MAG: Smr/MutS family protein [Flavobacteriaceae bacterium]
MNFKTGDSVLVLDENLSGTVKRITESLVFIETEDGFLLEFKPEELLKVKGEKSLRPEILLNHDLQDVINEKEKNGKRKPQQKTRAKDRYEPTMEVDLHIHQLVKSSRGMTNYDMLILQLETAKRQLDFAISKRIQKVVFIHGVGEGVLRTELEYLFGRYDNLKFYDANYQKYGVGATEVYIYQNTSGN